MSDYKLFTDGQLFSRWLDTKQILNEIQNEQDRRFIMKMIDEDGYCINDVDVDLTDLNIIKHKITLPVIISLKTVGNPYDNEGKYEVKGYNKDEMPNWTKYVIYPDLPSNEYQTTDAWVPEHNVDRVYTATGYCYFYVYSSKVSDMTSKCMYLDCDHEVLAMFQLVNVDDNITEYQEYIQDHAGLVDYLGVNFTLGDVYNREDFSVDTLVLIPQIKKQQ
jgi:hypothetical protein